MTADRLRRMLVGGVIAGPIYILVGAAQILLREGFDVTRHPLSFMSLGDLGWVQVANFVVTGLLALMAGVALRRLARSRRLRRWGASLIVLYGLCVIGGGVFPPDPSIGFPPGTPDTYPESVSWHAALHFLSGMAAFLSMVAASLVYASALASERDWRWAAFSALVALGYVAAIGATATGHGLLGLVLLYVAVALGWLWLTAICVRGLEDIAPTG